jgi:tetratricopeptide (TPR) repeat protein
MLPHIKTTRLKPIAAHKTKKIVKPFTGRQRRTAWWKPSYGLLILIVLILFGALQLVNKVEIPDDTGTTDTLPEFNETIATPEAEIPPPAQKLHELITKQPTEPAAEQPLVEPPVAEAPPAIVTALDSAAPEDETIQIAALTAPKDGAENLPLTTSPDRPLIKQEKPLPVKKKAPTESLTDTDYRNGSKKVLTVFFGNLRDGPSLEANVIGVAKQGDIVIDLREKDDWHFVKLADGHLGWMHQSLFATPKIAIEKVVKPEAPSATAKPATRSVPEGRVEILALAENVTVDKKEDAPSSSKSDISPAETSRTPKPAPIKPTGTQKEKSSPSEVPAAAAEPVLKTDNPEALEWTQKSFESVSQGKFTRAIEEAGKAIALDPGLVNPYINRAWAYSETGAYDKAIADCNTALTLDPDNGLAFNNRGLVYHRQGEENRAQKDYKIACDMGIKVGCDNYQVVTTRIAVNKLQLASEQNIALRKWDTVMQLNTEILQLDPTNESALSTRAMAEKMKLRDHEDAMQFSQLSYESVVQGNYAQSIDEASKAISLNPGLVNPYINRAWAYSETGVYDKAIADCDTALKLDPDNALAFNNRGLAYHRQGAKENALNDYKKACELDLSVACRNYKQLFSAQ